MTDDTPDPQMTAAVALLGRTGAADIQIRYSDDETPTIWFTVAHYRTNPNGRHRRQGPVNRWETAAGHNPTEALLRLCERVIDGGHCAHCGRTTMFYAELDTDPTPLDALFCAYEWDPELATFRRSCEGDTGTQPEAAS